MLIEIPELNTKDIGAIDRMFRRVYVGRDENEKQEYEALEKLKPLITSILLLSKINKTCKWVYDFKSDYYETECKNVFHFVNDGINENEFKFCPYCGKSVGALFNSSD